MSAGNEVLAFCGSCKMDLLALVVARTNGKIAKVQCKTCKKERGYKPPKGVTEPGASPTMAAKTSKKKAAAADAEAAKTVSIEAEWNRLMKDAATATKHKYSIKAKLDLGHIIDHPSFGTGIVTRLIHPDKAEILFKSDMKLLIHSK